MVSRKVIGLPFPGFDEMHGIGFDERSGILGKLFDSQLLAFGDEFKHLAAPFDGDLFARRPALVEKLEEILPKLGSLHRHRDTMYAFMRKTYTGRV